MQDGIDRGKYFLDKVKDEPRENIKLYFPMHALFLLGELEVEECLPIALNILRLDEYFGLLVRRYTNRIFL